MKKLLLSAVVLFALIGCSGNKVVKCSLQKDGDTQKLELTYDSQDKVTHLKMSSEKKINKLMADQIKPQAEEILSKIKDLDGIKYKYNLTNDVYSFEEEFDIAKIMENKSKYEAAGLNLDQMDLHIKVDKLKDLGFECK